MTAAHPFQHSGRALLSKGGWLLFFSFSALSGSMWTEALCSSAPFQRGETLKLHSVPIPIMRVSY